MWKPLRHRERECQQNKFFDTDVIQMILFFYYSIAHSTLYFYKKWMNASCCDSCSSIRFYFHLKLAFNRHTFEHLTKVLCKCAFFCTKNRFWYYFYLWIGSGRGGRFDFMIDCLPVWILLVEKVVCSFHSLLLKIFKIIFRASGLLERAVNSL